MNPLPGDVGFTKGAGLVGAGIRHFTGSSSAHSLIFVRECVEHERCWIAHEAFGSKDPVTGLSGIRERHRLLDEEPIRVVTLARTQEERDAIVQTSQDCVDFNRGYDWLSINAIALYSLAVLCRFLKWHEMQWLLTKLTILSAKVSPTWMRICSNHCLTALLSARPELEEYTVYTPDRVHPGRLDEACQLLGRLTWEDAQVSILNTN